jgi:hypothetical protein
MTDDHVAARITREMDRLFELITKRRCAMNFANWKHQEDGKWVWLSSDDRILAEVYRMEDGTWRVKWCGGWHNGKYAPDRVWTAEFKCAEDACNAAVADFLAACGKALIATLASKKKPPRGSGALRFEEIDRDVSAQSTNKH